jgi:hypothetical protein
MSLNYTTKRDKDTKAPLTNTENISERRSFIGILGHIWGLNNKYYVQSPW